MSSSCVIITLVLSITLLSGGFAMVGYGVFEVLKEKATYTGRAAIDSFHVTSQYVNSKGTTYCFYAYEFSTVSTAALVTGHSASQPCVAYSTYLVVETAAKADIVHYKTVDPSQNYLGDSTPLMDTRFDIAYVLISLGCLAVIVAIGFICIFGCSLCNHSRVSASSAV